MKIISPHLSIYKFPITAISSITNRVSGIYITFVGLGYVGFSFSNELYKNKLYSFYHNLNDYKKTLLHSIFLYPFGYHFSGGFRHLLWDSFPHLLTNSRVANSSRALFIISLLPTMLLENKLKKKFTQI